MFLYFVNFCVIYLYPEHPELRFLKCWFLTNAWSGCYENIYFMKTYHNSFRVTNPPSITILDSWLWHCTGFLWFYLYYMVPFWQHDNLKICLLLKKIVKLNSNFSISWNFHIGFFWCNSLKTKSISWII